MLNIDINWISVGLIVAILLLWSFGLFLSNRLKRSGDITSGLTILDWLRKGVASDLSALWLNVLRLLFMLTGSGLLYITGMMLYVGLENVTLLSRDGMYQALTIVILYAALLATVFNIFYQLVQQPLLAFRLSLQKYLPSGATVVLFWIEAIVMALFLAFASFIAATMFVGEWNALQLMALWIIPVILIAFFKLSVFYKSNIALFFAVISLFHLGYLRAKHLHERPANFVIVTSDDKRQEANVFVASGDGLYYFTPKNTTRKHFSRVNCGFLSGNHLTFKPWTSIASIDPIEERSTEIAQAMQMISFITGTSRVVDLGSNSRDTSGQLSGLLTGTAYMFGIFLGVLGILKIKDHVENPSQHRLQEGAIRLTAGGGLFALPIVYESMSACVGDGNNVTAAELDKIEFNVK